MELGIAPDMLEDVQLLFGIAESTVNTGRGPLTGLKNWSTGMQAVVISLIYVLETAVLKDLEHLKTYSPINCTTAELTALKSFENNKNLR